MTIDVTQDVAINFIEFLLAKLHEQTGATEVHAAEPARQVTTVGPKPINGTKVVPAKHHRAGGSPHVYALNVQEGNTIQMHQPTPAAVKIIDVLREHPRSTKAALVARTHYSQSTVEAVLGELRRQSVLVSEAARR